MATMPFAMLMLAFFVILPLFMFPLLLFTLIVSLVIMSVLIMSVLIMSFMPIVSFMLIMARAMLLQMPGACECFKMILDRVSVGAGCFCCFGDGHAPALAAEFENLDG